MRGRRSMMRRMKISGVRIGRVWSRKRRISGVRIGRVSITRRASIRIVRMSMRRERTRIVRQQGEGEESENQESEDHW
eukprot:4887508-Pyramimonas_sp.AAC.1